jgi:hypothetical protein
MQSILNPNTMPGYTFSGSRSLPSLVLGKMETARRIHFSISNFGIFPISNFGTTKRTSDLLAHEDFGVRIDAKTLFNIRIGSYRVVRPLDMQTYKNGDEYSATFTVFPRIIGVGRTDYEAQENAIRHLLHSRNFYERLSPERGTQGAKRQGILMRQYLQHS